MNTFFVSPRGREINLAPNLEVSLLIFPVVLMFISHSPPSNPPVRPSLAFQSGDTFVYSRQSSSSKRWKTGDARVSPISIWRVARREEKFFAGSVIETEDDIGGKIDLGLTFFCSSCVYVTLVQKSATTVGIQKKNLETRFASSICARGICF